ncbi:MAG: NTP transferase domain-containing protein, partial [Sphingomonadaceae bacterium]
MTRLGAIIAGGQSSRFGADKAQAMLDGRALLEHVADRLDAQCDAVI